MKKQLKQLIALALILQHSFALAQKTQIPRPQLIAHLKKEREEFREFYAREQFWLSKRLIPLVNELVQGNKLLDKHEAELKSWGTLEEISERLSPEHKIRALRMHKEVEDAGLYLAIAEINLRKSVSKHLDSLQEIYEFVGQVGAKYEILDTNLKIILALYHNEETHLKTKTLSAELQQKFLARQAKLKAIKTLHFEKELERIDRLLQAAKRYESRTLWLSALRSYHSLLDDKFLAAQNAASLLNYHNKITLSEITHETAKKAFKNILLQMSDRGIKMKPEAKNFFKKFLLDPYPRMKAYYQAEVLLAEAMQKHLSLYQAQPTHAQFTLVGMKGKGSGKDAKNQSHISDDQLEVTRRVFNERDVQDGQVIERIKVEVFTTDSKGNKTVVFERSEIEGTQAAKNIRDALKISPSTSNFENNDTVIIDRPRTTISHPEPSKATEIDAEALPSPSSSDRISTQVSTTETSKATTTEIQVGDPIAPSESLPNQKELYSPDSLIDRADVHNGTLDFSNKTSSFDKELSNLSREVQAEIRAGETALQSGFFGAIEKLKAEMNQQNRSFPEATTSNFDSSDPESIKSNIAQAKSILSKLREKLNSATHPQSAALKLGLDTAESLLDSAAELNSAGESETAKDLIDMALDLIGEYGSAILHIGAGFTPAGDLVDLVEVISGRDVVTGEEIGDAGRVQAALGLIVGNRVMWSKLSSAFGKIKNSASKQIFTGFINVADHNPINPGPLDQIMIPNTSIPVSSTFRSSTYTMMTRTTNTKVYRVVGPKNNPRGNYWSLNKPTGPTSTIIDQAILGEFGNPATKIIEAEIPNGVPFGIGVAGPQGKMPGGGIQLYIKDPDVLIHLKEIGK